MGNFDTSHDEHCKILLEEVATHKVVLEFNDVVYQQCNCSNLIVFQSIVNGCRVVETNAILLGYLVLEDDWVFG
jgi:hypothetical protein